MEYKPRTLSEILSDMLTDKAARPALSVLTNPSNTSIWYNILGAVAVEVNLLEELGVVLFEEVEKRSQEIPVGTLFWYAAETLKYQHGDALEIINGIPQYLVIDESKQIIKASAIVEQSGALIIKCAKEVSGNIVPLSSAELSGVEQYWIEKRFAGVSLAVTSLNPDIVKTYLRIEVDGQLLALDGESLSIPGTYPVEVAILEYYKTLDFGGRLSVMDLIDAVQSVEGTKNVSTTDIQAQSDAGTSWIDVLGNPDKIYISVAGYMTEDPSNILRNTLTYFI